MEVDGGFVAAFRLLAPTCGKSLLSFGDDLQLCECWFTARLIARVMTVSTCERMPGGIAGKRLLPWPVLQESLGMMLCL